MKRGLFIFSLLFCVVATNAQQAAASLGDAINTKEDELNPILSPDGSTLYFNRVSYIDNEFGKDEIYRSTLQNGKWSQAEPVKELNISQSNAVFGITEDGNTLLIKNVYNKSGTKYSGRGLSLITKNGDKWGTPVPIKSKIDDKGQVFTAYMTPDGKTIVLSYSKDKDSDSNDLYVIEKKEGNNWSSPTPLTSLNSDNSSEDAPFLSEDKKTIYFSSNRGKGNKYNIYSADRVGEDWERWSDPKELPTVINGRGWESYYRTDLSGKTKIWSTNTGTRAKGDIYTLKGKEYIYLSGVLRNMNNNKPLDGRNFQPGKNFNLLANGKPVDSLVINPDGSYSAKIPSMTGPINITINAPHFAGNPEKIDPKKVIGGKEKRDLNLKPDSYVLLKGRTIIQNTGQPIPFDNNTKIMVNKVPVDSVKYDKYAGTYEMKLPYGKVYDVEVMSSQFKTLPRMVDLSRVTQYEERTADLYVAAGQVATSKGKIVDATTKKPIPGARIEVEGRPELNTEIDPNTGEYTLQLPSGNLYNIVVKAPQYISENFQVDSRAGGNMTIMKDAALSKLEVGKHIRLKQIFFEFGKATLTPASYPELDRVVGYFKDFPTLSAQVEGHTDNVSSAQHNLELSQNRAQAVVSYLISKGVPANQVFAKGFGMTRPVASNATPAGRALNRRVEFVILGI